MVVDVRPQDFHAKISNRISSQVENLKLLAKAIVMAAKVIC